MKKTRRTSVTEKPAAKLGNRAMASGMTLESELSIPDGFMYREETLQLNGQAYSVPTKKRLFIESVSGCMDIPTGQTPVRIAFRSQKQGTTRPQHWLRPDLLASDHNGADHYVIDERRIAALAAEGESVVISAARTGFTGQANLRLTLTGYLST